MLRYYTDFQYDGKPCFIALSRTYLFIYKQPHHSHLYYQQDNILTNILSQKPTIILPFHSYKITPPDQKFNDRLVIQSPSFFSKKHIFTCPTENSSVNDKLMNFYIDIEIVKRDVNDIFTMSDLDSHENSTNK